VFTIADFEEHEKKEQESANVHLSTGSESKFKMSITTKDIMQAFNAFSEPFRSSGDAIDEPFNPDNLFAVEQPSQTTARNESEQSPRKQVDNDMNIRASPKNKVFPIRATQPSQMSSEKDEFLRSLLRKGLSTEQSSISRTDKLNTMMHTPSIELERVHEQKGVATVQKKQGTVIDQSMSESRIVPRPPTLQAIPQESHQQGPSPQRFSNSTLKCSESVELSNMLNKKLRLYSVQPNQLAYASRSASKSMKVELEKLGYFLVPSPKRMDTSLTMNEKTILSFQHEIRKQYQIAIYRANEEATKYREYLKQRNQKKLMREL